MSVQVTPLSFITLNKQLFFLKQGDRSITGSNGDPGLPGLDGVSVPCPLVQYLLFPFLHGLCVSCCGQAPS